MSAQPPPPPPSDDAPPGYGSLPSAFEGVSMGGPHVMATTDQNDDRDPAAEALVREFEAYDFGNDAEFRKGLPAILKQAKGKSADIDAIIGRAQWFYFNKRKGVDVPFETYRRYRKGELESRPMGTSKKFGSLMSGGEGGSAASASQPSSTSAPAAPGSSHVPAGMIGAAAGGALDAPPAQPAAVHTEGISVVSAEDDTAQTRAAVVVESSGVVTSGAATDVPSNDMPFDQVVRLIQEGRANEVPRKEIPEGLNDEPASRSTMAPRRKPWESAGSAAEGGQAQTEAAQAQPQSQTQSQPQAQTQPHPQAQQQPQARDTQVQQQAQA